MTNDTDVAISNNNTVNNSNALTQLEALYAEQITWNDTLYKASTTQLYSMLAGCLDVCEQLKGEIKRRKLLDNWLAAAGLKFNEGTALATKVVRYVFRIDNKRSSIYSRVLRIAIADGVKAEGFAAWVIECGGIEEVRRTAASGVSAAAKKKQIAKDAAEILLEADALMTLSDLPQALDVNTDGAFEFSLALVRKNKSTGVAEIVYGTNDGLLIKAFLASVGKGVIASAEDKTTAEELERASAARSALIDAAIANVKRRSEAELEAKFNTLKVAETV